MSEDKKENKMKVVSINDAPKKSEDEVIDFVEKRKAACLEILDAMRDLVEAGEIQEFTATSLDSNGEAQIHCYVGDVAVGVGLYEIGKNILMNQYMPED